MKENDKFYLNVKLNGISSKIMLYVVRTNFILLYKVIVEWQPSLLVDFDKSENNVFATLRKENDSETHPRLIFGDVLEMSPHHVC